MTYYITVDGERVATTSSLTVFLVILSFLDDSAEIESIRFGCEEEVI